MSSAIVIAGMAVINLVLRCPIFLAANRVRIPDLLRRALGYSPIAVLTAIIVPTALHLDGGQETYTWQNPDLIAAIAAALTSWISRNILLTIAVGMVLAIGLRQIGF